MRRYVDSARLERDIPKYRDPRQCVISLQAIIVPPWMARKCNNAMAICDC